MNLGFELYDLLSDPREAKNLAAERPTIVKRLKAEYDAWFDDVSSTRPDNYAPPRIILGTQSETSTHLTKQDWRDTRGGGWGEHGRWLLRIEGNRAYDVSVRLTEPRSGRAVLKFGGREASRTLADSAQTIVFPNVRPPAGDGELTFTISRDGMSWGPYQVTVTQR